MAWEPDALRREIDKAIDDYADAVAAGRVTVVTGMVTTVMRLDGVLGDIQIDPRAMRKLSPDCLCELLTEAIRAAEAEAACRCGELAGKVTFLGYPVDEMIDDMINRPEDAVRRMAAGPGWW
jgi:DNA-binding protein YbaB